MLKECLKKKGEGKKDEGRKEENQTKTKQKLVLLSVQAN